MKIELTVKVKGEQTKVFAAFDRQLFEALTPAPVRKRMREFEGCFVGNRYSFETTLGLWKGVITERVEGERESYFVDEGTQLPWPLTFWRHRHVVRVSKKGCLIVDDIEYKTMHPLLDKILRPALWAFFKARHPIYQRYFAARF